MRNVKTHGGLTRGRGMTETQRLLWVLSMPGCADMNESMQKLTGVSFETSDQHKDMTESRQARDVKDTIALISYLRDRDPFTQNTDSLLSIATGMTAQEGVNAEKARYIGESIMTSMIGQSVDDFVFPKAAQAVPLGAKTVVKIHGDTVTVDPQLIFQRLVAVGIRTEDVQSLFAYELCSPPPALFESSGLPLQANKAALADTIWKSLKSDQTLPGENVQYILDGGALLHRFPWPRGSTGIVCVTSTCDMSRKNVGQLSSSLMATQRCLQQRMPHIWEGVPLALAWLFISPEGWWSSPRKKCSCKNPINKQWFIHRLSQKLQMAGCHTDQARHDADLLIVQTAIASARQQPTVLIGDDTDLLVLLLYHREMDGHDLCLSSEPKQHTQKNKVWYIKQAKHLLGSSVCGNILSMHAILGCDTTSHLFGLGKGLVLKKIQDLRFYQQAVLFNNTGAQQSDIIVAGEHALILLYGGDMVEGLDSLRYKWFFDKVPRTTSHVDPQYLPPTSATPKYHSLRVYYQVMEWKGEHNHLSPEKWGWHIIGGKYLPRFTDKPAAPTELLEVIYCGCKKDCNTRKCTCRKYGLTLFLCLWTMSWSELYQHTVSRYEYRLWWHNHK